MSWIGEKEEGDEKGRESLTTINKEEEEDNKEKGVMYNISCDY